MSETPAAASEAAIRDLVETFAGAIRARDIGAVLAVFAPDVVSFDLTPPLRHGADTFRERWRAVFDAVEGPIDYQVHELDITAGGDLAFSRSLNRTQGQAAGGRTVDRWVRWTACYRQIDDAWRIVHEHVSVPVDVKSGAAALNLTP